MTHSHDIPYDSSDQSPDYNQKLADLLEHEFPNLILPKRSFDAMVAGLDISRQNNGGDPESENYKDYHNDEHPFGMVQRAYSLLGLLKEAGVDVQTCHYEVVGIATTFHDGIVRKPVDLDPEDADKSVEQLSADLALQHMPLQRYPGDPNGFIHEERSFVYSGIEVTEVEHQDGQVLRPKVFEPGRHWTGWVITTADTGNAFFEDLDVNIRDLSRLSTEYSDQGSKNVTLVKDSVKKLLQSEKPFLERLDIDLHRGILKFFPEKADRVTEVLDAHFEHRFSQMLKAADVIDNHLAVILTAVEEMLHESKDSLIRRTDKIHETIMRVLRNLPPSSSE